MTDLLALDARSLGLELSRRARRLLSKRAYNDLARESLLHGGNEWIVVELIKRFRRAYAQTVLGYRTSGRRDPWHRKDPGRWPETYDQKKRQWQGHDDPLVWTGRLRDEILRNAVTKATATGGNARGRITLGRLSVKTREGWVAPRRMVIDTLLGGPGRRLPASEVATIRAGFLAYARATLAGVTAPTKQPVFPPSVIMDRRQQRYSERRAMLVESQRQRDAIEEAGRDRRARAAERLAAWRGDAGGAARLGQRAMTAAERRLAHRAQALASYRRRRHVINPRRRLRRRRAI